MPKWRDKLREILADVSPEMWLGVIAIAFAIVYLLVQWFVPGLLPEL